MEFITVTVLFVTISLLTILNFLIHKTRRGRLIDKIPGPPGLPVLGNGLDVSVPLGKCFSNQTKKKVTTENLPVLRLVEVRFC